MSAPFHYVMFKPWHSVLLPERSVFRPNTFGPLMSFSRELIYILPLYHGKAMLSILGLTALNKSIHLDTKNLGTQQLLKFQGFFYHRSDKVRTCGLHVPNVARYQLRYTPIHYVASVSRQTQVLLYEVFFRNARVFTY